MRKIVLACLVFFAAPLLMLGQVSGPASVVASAFPPVWVTITAENQNIEVTLPAGTIYRFGDTKNNVWSATTTAPQALVLNPVFYSSFPFADPDPGTVKELDVLEVVGPQTVTITNLGTAATTEMTIPGLVPPVTIPTPPGQAYAVTLAISQTAVAPENVNWVAVGLGLYDFPKSGADTGYIGSIVTLTIDGVAFQCTYGSQVGGVFTMNCAVQEAPQ